VGQNELEKRQEFVQLGVTFDLISATHSTEASIKTQAHAFDAILLLGLLISV